MSESPWLREIPRADEILHEVLTHLDKEYDFRRRIKNSEIPLSQAAIKLERACHKRYREYENVVREKYLKRGVDPAKLEKSLMQTRATRAGRTVELIIHTLLDIVGIPNEKNVRYPHRDGETLDIVIPSSHVLKIRPKDAIIISIKRQVRERWREIVGEAYILRKIHGIPDNIWFVTITCNISTYIVRSMTKLEIRVYVPNECYEEFKDVGARCVSDLVNDVKSFLESRGLLKQTSS